MDKKTERISIQNLCGSMSRTFNMNITIEFCYNQSNYIQQYRTKDNNTIPFFWWRKHKHMK